MAEPSRERLGSLHDEVLRLGRIVEDLGTLASAEAAALRLERHRVDLAEVARDASAALAPQFAAGEIELVADLHPAPVEGDRDRLTQVVANLLGNALKFTPVGGRVVVEVAANGDVELAVRDTGPGIPADELPHVFERFWRGRGAAEVGGSGVGLAVVAELVRAHGGEVAAATRPEGGAAFTVRLPRA
jgi:two-component system sensor histidine kinase BaeS